MNQLKSSPYWCSHIIKHVRVSHSTMYGPSLLHTWHILTSTALACRLSSRLYLHESDPNSPHHRTREQHTLQPKSNHAILHLIYQSTNPSTHPPPHPNPTPSIHSQPIKPNQTRSQLHNTKLPQNLKFNHPPTSSNPCTSPTAITPMPSHP